MSNHEYNRAIDLVARVLCAAADGDVSAREIEEASGAMEVVQEYIGELRNALRPFAELAKHRVGARSDAIPDEENYLWKISLPPGHGPGPGISVRHIRDAANVLGIPFKD